MLTTLDGKALGYQVELHRYCKSEGVSMDNLLARRPLKHTAPGRLQAMAIRILQKTERYLKAMVDDLFEQSDRIDVTEEGKLS